MAKRKNSTALFEVMAAHRARQQHGQQDDGAAKPASANTNGTRLATAAPAGGSSPAKVANAIAFPPTTSGRSFAPPPGQLVKSAGRPSLLAAGKQWLDAKIEQRRQAAAAAAELAAAQAAEEDVAADGEDPTAGVTAHSLAARGAAVARRQAVAAVAEAPAPIPRVTNVAPVADSEVAADESPAAADIPSPGIPSPTAAVETPANPAPATTAATPPATPRTTFTTVMPTYGRRSVRPGTDRAEPARPGVAARFKAFGLGWGRRDATAAETDPDINGSPDIDGSRPARGRPGDRVAIDRDKHEVTLKVPFQTVAIGVTAFLVVVGTAYIAGKHVGQPTRPAAGNSQAQGQTQPGALDPRTAKAGQRGPAAGGQDAIAAGGKVPANRDQVTQVQPAATGGQTSQVTPPPPYEDVAIVNTAAKRTVGLNYVIVNTYAPDFQASAIEVSDFLNANGIPNTIEIGTPAISCKTGDFAITGTRGFARPFMDTPEYKQYMQTIQTVAAKFSQKSKLNKPRTMTVKWPG